MMSPSAKSCHTTGFVNVVGTGPVVGGAVEGGVVGAVAPVQATPFTAKATQQGGTAQQSGESRPSVPTHDGIS